MTDTQETWLLITGGSGFFGGLLQRRLLNEGFHCANIDLQPDEMVHPRLESVVGDIRQREQLEGLFRRHPFQAVFHCAAILAHDCHDQKFLWTSNVDGTANVAEMAQKYGVRKVIFTSSNCLWGQSLGRPVTEDDPPRPVEIYGRSKWAAEQALGQYAGALDVITIRCPTIIDSGRLGLLTILFDFIAEGRKVWMVGGGRNRYQFIYGQDLADACLKALDYNRSNTFGIGSDDVKTLRDVYSYVIEKAGTGARVATIPRTPAVLAMRLAHTLKVSPLGPYHYRMIAEDFVFDTTRIKATLDWRPTRTNEEMLHEAYVYYRTNYQDIHARRNVSAHRRSAPMGAIRLLKWLS